MLTIQIHNARNFNEKRKSKLLRAVARAEYILNSLEFREDVLTHSYWYSTGRLWWKKWHNPKAFRWNEGLSNTAIYNKIMQGAEVLLPEVDYKMDLDIECVMARHNGVLGYTYPNTVRTWIYSWFFDSASEEEIVGNLVHEWMHMEDTSKK